MVGQTRKGLDTDDIGHSGVDQLHHFTCQEPAFSILVAQRQVGPGHVGDAFNGLRRLKALALAQGVNGRSAQSPQNLNSRLGRKFRAPARTQKFMAVFSAQQAVVEKVQHIGNHSLGSLRLQNLHQMVVRQRHVLDQNLSYDAHPRLAQSLIDG